MRAMQMRQPRSLHFAEPRWCRLVRKTGLVGEEGVLIILSLVPAGVQSDGDFGGDLRDLYTMNGIDLRLSRVMQLFAQHGGSQYGGESVTQLEHALQSALLAEQLQSPPTLVAAALLHDVGHLLHELPDDAPERGIDDRHEQLGADFVGSHFVRETVDPIRLHVAAKRYLCTVDEHYILSLSPPSITSLYLQGGRMNAVEVAAFEAEPLFQEAVLLRRWDDTAKIPDLQTPTIDHFLPALESSLLPSGN